MSNRTVDQHGDMGAEAGIWMRIRAEIALGHRNSPRNHMASRRIPPALFVGLTTMDWDRTLLNSGALSHSEFKPHFLMADYSFQKLFYHLSPP